MFRIVMIAGLGRVVDRGALSVGGRAEIRSVVKDTKRELLRSNLSARASESFPNFEKEAREKEVDGQQEAAQSSSVRSSGKSLNPQEEQVLNDVLSEFLG